MIATLSMTAAADKELRMHAPFDHDTFETDGYVEAVELLDAADSRVRMGDCWMYCWNDCKWGTNSPLVRYLWMIDDNEFNLNMLDDGQLDEYGSLAL
jgi:hypothetical protein